MIIKKTWRIAHTIIIPSIIKCNHNTYIRDDYNSNSKIIEMYIFGYDDPLKYLPENTEIEILARSIKRDKINNIEYYWYYCKIDPKNKLQIVSKRYGWILGKDIDME